MLYLFFWPSKRCITSRMMKKITTDKKAIKYVHTITEQNFIHNKKLLFGIVSFSMPSQIIFTVLAVKTYVYTNKYINKRTYFLLYITVFYIPSLYQKICTHNI